MSGKSAVGAVAGTLNVTLWSFIGLETAAVAAGVVENPKRNVPIATVGGVLLAAVAYVLSSTAIMGMIPNAALAKSSSPFADAVKLAVGDFGLQKIVKTLVDLAADAAIEVPSGDELEALTPFAMEFRYHTLPWGSTPIGRERMVALAVEVRDWADGEVLKARNRAAE